VSGRIRRDNADAVRQALEAVTAEDCEERPRAGGCSAAERRQDRQRADRAGPARPQSAAAGQHAGSPQQKLDSGLQWLCRMKRERARLGANMPGLCFTPSPKTRFRTAQAVQDP